MFTIASFGLAFATAIILAVVIRTQRFQLVKPSIIFLVFFNIQTQLPSAFQAAWIEETLADPWEYFLLAQVFPFGALLLTVFGFRQAAQRVYERAVQSVQAVEERTDGVIILLAALSALCMGWYLVRVPWSQTGLYALLFDTSRAFASRQESMALLNDSFLRYAFAAMSFVFAPLLAILVTFRLRFAVRTGNPTLTLLYAALMAGTVVLVSMYGARGPSVTVLLGVIYAVSLQKRFPFTPLRLALLLSFALLVPGLISLRNTEEHKSDVTVREVVENVVDRVFSRNIVTNVWTIDYVQRYGTFGVAGIPKLAEVLGEQPVDIFNVIGVAWDPTNVTIGANSPFMFAYHACFGFAAFLPCLLLTFLLDVPLLLYPRVAPKLLIPCIAATAIAVTKFTFTFWTTAFFSGGFGLISLVCILATFHFRIGASSSQKGERPRSAPAPLLRPVWNLPAKR